MKSSIKIGATALAACGALGLGASSAKSSTAANLVETPENFTSSPANGTRVVAGQNGYASVTLRTDVYRRSA